MPETNRRIRPADQPYVVWGDLEMTGNGQDPIIEVGFAVTDRALKVLDTYTAVIWPGLARTPEGRETEWRKRYLPAMDPVVRDMHDTSGLSADVVTNGRPMAEVDREVEVWLRTFSPSGSHLPFAGSGVSHFDRPYMIREMPRTNRRLAYWHYDIGVLRRFMRWWGITAPQAEQALDGKTHRALDDTKAAIAEARAWMARLRVRDLSHVLQDSEDADAA